MRAPRHCDTCGEFRRNVAKGLCARCYRVSRLHDDRCAGCEQIRPIEGGQHLCQACLGRARARVGTCSDCQRQFRRLYGARCRQCQRRANNPTGRCQDCNEPAEITNGRCRACYEHSRRHPMGTCNACGNQFPIGARGVCRMCMNTRRARHLNKDPAIKTLLEHLSDYAHARGWSAAILSQARTSLRMVLAARDELGPPPWPSTAIQEQLAGTTRHRHATALRRVTDFLIDEGLAKTSTELTFQLWLDTQFLALHPQVAAELTAWTRALLGRGVRARKPLQNSTIRSYVWILQDPLATWSHSHESLREITREAIDDQISTFTGAKRSLAASAMRSLFTTLKAQRIVFTNPTTHLTRYSSPPAAPIGLQPADRARLLTGELRPDETLMVLLAGVHALRAGQIIKLRIDDVDLPARTITIAGTSRALDTLTARHLTAWLTYRRRRWPYTANPHLLISHQTANSVAAVNIGHVSKTFRALGHTAHQLRVDRFLDEVHNGDADPIRFTRLFGVTAPTALHYCADATELDQPDPPADPNPD